MATYTITYNRATKRYEVDNGRSPPLADFADKLQAQQCIIAHRSPDVYGDTLTLAQRWPQLAARAWKAARLYLDGHVTRLPNGRFTVRSQSSATLYHLPADLTHCTCPDFAGSPGARPRAPTGPAGRRWCKHLLACTLHVRHNSGCHRSRYGPVRQEVPQRQILVTHRGRTIAQTRPADADDRTAGDDPHFTDGAPIPARLRSHARAFHETTGQWPRDRDHLLAWIYR